MKIFKTLANNLAYTILGALIFVIGGVALASNLGVLNSTQKGDLTTGMTSGNYQLLHPGADGTILIASSTSVNGLIWGTASTTGGSGISNLNGLVATTQTFATTAAGSIFNVTSSGSTHTFTFPTTPTFTGITVTNASTTNLTVATNTYLPSITNSFLAVDPSGKVIATTTPQLQGNYITALTGDVTASGPGSVPSTLATVNSNVGSFGSSTAIPNFTVNGKGLITAAGTNVVIAPAGTLTGATLASGVTASSLTSVGTLTALTVSGQTALANASTTNLTVATNIYLPGVSNCNGITFLQITSGIFGCGTPSGGGSLAGGINGYVTRWTGTSTVSTGILLDNGTVAGANATSSTVSFNVQGTGTLNPFNVASSSGTSQLIVTSAGNVGIGTSTPIAKLEVASGNILLDNGLFQLGGTTASQVALKYSFLGGVPRFQMRLADDSGYSAFSAGAGEFGYNVAVGGSIAAADAGISNYRVMINKGDVGDILVESGSQYSWSGTAGNLYGASADTGLSRLAANKVAVGNGIQGDFSGTLIAGNIGIGTTTPGNALTVVGSISSSALTSGNCVQASTGGLLTTVGAPCGSGGSGNSAFTIGSGKIFNATSTDLVGIGTSSPTTTLFVQGKGGTSPFAVTSSTGASLLTVGQDGAVLIKTGSTSGFEVQTPSGSVVLTLDAPNGGNLDVGNQIALGGNLRSRNNPFFISGFNNNVGGVIKLGSTAASNDIMVGVGTSTPVATLAVAAMASFPAFDVSSTSNASMFRINANGNVGIGTSTPLATFTIQGKGGTNPFAIASSTGTQLVMLDQAGNLGIGVAVASDTLETSGGIIMGNNQFLQSRFAGSVVKLMNFSSGGILQIKPNATGLVTIGGSNSLNALSINTSTSVSTLDVYGNPTVNKVVNFGSSTGASLFTVLANGNVGINTSSPVGTLAVNGRVYMVGLTTSGSSQPAGICQAANGELINDTFVGCVASSKRFKTDIKTEGLGLDLFLKLNPVSYFYKTDWLGGYAGNQNYNGKQFGVIAEDVQKIAPELVTVENETSSYDGALPGTVQGLQDFAHWLGPITLSFQQLQKQIDDISVGKVKRSAEENWQWVVMALLALGYITNSIQIRRLKKKS